KHPWDCARGKVTDTFDQFVEKEEHAMQRNVLTEGDELHLIVVAQHLSARRKQIGTVEEGHLLAVLPKGRAAEENGSLDLSCEGQKSPLVRRLRLKEERHGSLWPDDQIHSCGC